MKKISKFVLLFIVCTFIFMGGVNAATGRAEVISKTRYRYQYSFGANNYSLYAQNAVLKGTNHSLYAYNIGLTEKDLYDIYDKDVDTFIPKEDFEKIKEAVYYGDMKYNETNNSEYLLVTYGLMIKALKPDKFAYSSYKDKESTYFEKLETSLQEEINNYFVKPSFDNEKIQLNLNESLDIIDKNNILSTYEIDSVAGDSVSYEIIDNKISLKVLKPGTTSFKLKKEYHDKDYNMELLSSKKGFGVTAGNFILYSTFSININGGRIALDIKDDKALDNGKLNATYVIYNKEDELVYQISTNTEGIFYTNYLPNGSYYVKELRNSDIYQKNNNIYKVNLNNDEQSVSIINHKKKVVNINNKVKENLRNITIKFVNEEGKMINDNIKFSIMDKNYQCTGKKDIVLKDGTYILNILEIPDEYIVDNKEKIISINDNMDVEITLKNKEEGLGFEEVSNASNDTIIIKPKEEVVEEINVPDTFSFNYLFIFVGLSYVKKFSKR